MSEKLAGKDKLLSIGADYFRFLAAGTSRETETPDEQELLALGKESWEIASQTKSPNP